MSFETVSGNKLKEYTKDQLDKLLGSIWKFNISDYVYPPFMLKRSYSYYGEDDYNEYEPESNDYYILSGIKNYEFESRIILYFMSINSETKTQKYVEWMVNVNNCGIIHQSSEHNSYNILEVYIYQMLCAEILDILPQYLKNKI